MADLVDVLIEDERWREFGLGALAQQACDASLRHFEMHRPSFEISLLGCDDVRISQLNSEYRQKPRPTNVLSWPSAERSAINPGELPKVPTVAEGNIADLGDIAIAYETCRTEAEQAGKPHDQHVCHLLVHATLHLLGYDHIVKLDAALMEEMERQVLATLGYPDPYESD